MESRLGAYPDPPEAPVRTASHRAAGRTVASRKPLVAWPLLAQLSRAFPLQEQGRVALRRAVAARCPQLEGDPVSAGLLGAGLCLCLEGVKSTDTVLLGAMTGLGRHYLIGVCVCRGTTGATGGEWIRATARGGDRLLQSVRLILTAWLDRPLGGLQIEGQQPSPPTV